METESNTRLRVFVCGTHRDLEDERKEVLEAIRKLHHEHDTMEYFGARPNTPIETCLTEVRKSDVLIVIVGHLYGSMIPEIGISFTEAEFLEGSHLGKPCLVYIISPKAKVLPINVETDPIKRDLLNKFKDSLRNKYTVREFDDSHDLAVSVTADLSRQAQEIQKATINNYKKQVEILEQGIEVWNIWRVKNPSIKPNLSNINLSKTNLVGCNFSGTNLRNANLSETKLTGVNLNGAKLKNANLRKAIMSYTILTNIDLSTTKGLQEVIHRKPSTIGLDTIIKSKGKIPEQFLRGCGLSDIEIEFAKLSAPGISADQVTDISYRINQLRVGRSIQYYSVFISYSSGDIEFAKRLHDDLQNNGVRCWFAPEDIQSGQKLFEQIDHAIQSYDWTLLILSENSINSEWVKVEIAKTREKEKNQKRRILIPIRLIDFKKIQEWEAFDADAGKDLSREVREYFIPDFSNWRDEKSYRAAFERLLKDLRAQEGVEDGE